MNKENRSYIPQMIFQAITVVVLVVIDRITKYLAIIKLNPENGGKPYKLIDKVLSFTYLENRGSIWGILQGKINFLLIISVLLFVILLYVYIKLPKNSNYNILLWIDAVMIAGALGNTYDRIFYDYVVDFIFVEIIHFPIFNFADCCITIAAVVTVVIILTKYKNDNFEFLSFKKKKSETTSEAENLTREDDVK